MKEDKLLPVRDNTVPTPPVFIIIVCDKDRITLPKRFYSEDMYDTAYRQYEDEQRKYPGERVFLCRVFAVLRGHTIRQTLENVPNASSFLKNEVLSFKEAPTFYIIEHVNLPIQFYEIPSGHSLETTERCLFGKDNNPFGFLLCIPMLSSEENM